MKPHILFSTLLIFASFSFSSLEAKRLNLQIADSSGDNQGIQEFLRKNPSIPNIPGVDDFKNAPNMPIPEPFFSIPGIVSTENDSSFVLLNVLPIEIKEVIATNVTTHNQTNFLTKNQRIYPREATTLDPNQEGCVFDFNIVLADGEQIGRNNINTCDIMVLIVTDFGIQTLENKPISEEKIPENLHKEDPAPVSKDKKKEVDL